MGSSGLNTEESSKVESTSLTETFEKYCPIYMSYGMSYNEFWHGDSYVVKFYREANKLRLQRADENFWAQGMYVYEAICDVAPILRPFSKERKPLPYPDKPYLHEKLQEKTEEQKENEIEAERLKAIIQFNNWFHATQRQFQNKE